MMDPLGKFSAPLKESPEQRSLGVVILGIRGRGLISIAIGTALLTHWFVVVVMLYETFMDASVELFKVSVMEFAVPFAEFGVIPVTADLDHEKEAPPLPRLLLNEMDNGLPEQTELAVTLV